MSQKKNVMIVFGTRPEAIKLWPIILKLQSQDNINLFVVNSAQHSALMNETIEDLGIKANLVFPQQEGFRTLSKLSATLMFNFDFAFEKSQPDIVIVQGDTSTAFHASLAAFHARIPIAHVEAGLRSRNLDHPFPEEFYRISISRIARLHFAPTESALENLRQEGISEDRLFVTGNTGIDALKLAQNRIAGATNREQSRGYVLVTCHRRESSGKRLQVLLEGIKDFACKYPQEEIRFVLHLNPSFYLNVKNSLAEIQNIKLLEPSSYFSFVELLSGSKFIVTDSGGIQEEAPYLEKLTLVYREVTERNEGVNLGYSRYLPSDREAIVNELTRALEEKLDPGRMLNPYGDGNAAYIVTEKILEFLEEVDRT